MELRHLRTFRAVAEERHFSRAAAKLHVAQPALSRTIADLEAEMGVRLIDRNTRGMMLTEAGELFLSRVQQILRETDEAVTAAQRRSRGETGILRIGFIGTLSQTMLPRILMAYRKRFPAVDLSLRELGPAQQRQEIVMGRLDCGFIGLVTASDDAELEMLTAGTDTLVVAMPAEHRLTKKSVLHLRNLKDEDFYLTERSNAPAFNPWLVGLCQKAGFEPRVVRETDRAATILNYVAAGFGVSIFPSQIAQRATPGVKFIPLSGRLPAYRYQLAWLRGNTSSALLEFRTIVQQRLR